MQSPGELESGGSVVVAESAGGREIVVTRRGSGAFPALLIGGVHGDESEGFLLAERFLESIDAGETRLDERISLFVCARLNPDGCAALRRTNQRNVDLNRNLPTRDWSGDFQNPRYYPGPSAGSEVESEATLKLLESINPKVIISLHSYEHAMVNFNGPCEDLATAMGASNGLPPKGDIGYPTPGSLGTYSGWERGIPTLTLEVLRGQSPEEVWPQHREGLQVAFEFYLTNPHPQG